MNARKPGMFGLTKIVILTSLCLLVTACGPGKKSKTADGVASDPAADSGSTFTGPREDGVGSGGGGDVIVCHKDGKIVDIESLDIYHINPHYNLTFARKALGENDISIPEASLYGEQINLALDHLESFDPVFAGKVREVADSLVKETDLVARGEKSSVVNPVAEIEINAVTNDSSLEHLPSKTANCEFLTQQRMFWQVDDPGAHQYGYQVNLQLWKLSPESVKAKLITHESVWKREREMFGKPETSMNSQYFNAVLHSNEFNKYTLSDYVTLLRSLKYPDDKTWYKDGTLFSLMETGAIFDTHSILIYNMDSPPLGIASASSEYPTAHVKGRLLYPQEFDVAETKIKLEGQIVIDNDGLVLQGCVDPDPTGYDLNVDGVKTHVEDGDEIFLTNNTARNSQITKVQKASTNCQAHNYSNVFEELNRQELK